MAKALFHKNQRVYVRPVGTWALVEKVVPHWTKGLDEPLRVYYDVGLGREFAAEELQSDGAELDSEAGERWRIVRMPNRWQSSAETAQHPYPGTYPVVVTGEADWGGWRVPGSEYALSPSRIEGQARMVASAPQLAAALKTIVDWVEQSGETAPPALAKHLDRGSKLLAWLAGTPEG